MIVDGEGSKTVFNGHEPQVDQKFTSSNCMIAGTVDFVAWWSNCGQAGTTTKSAAIYSTVFA